MSPPEVMKVIHSTTDEIQCAICPVDYLALITLRSGRDYTWSWQCVSRCEPARSYLAHNKLKGLEAVDVRRHGPI